MHCLLLFRRYVGTFEWYSLLISLAKMSTNIICETTNTTTLNIIRNVLEILNGLRQYPACNFLLYALTLRAFVQIAAA